MGRSRKLLALFLFLWLPFHSLTFCFLSVLPQVSAFLQRFCSLVCHHSWLSQQLAIPQMFGVCKSHSETKQRRFVETDFEQSNNWLMELMCFHHKHRKAYSERKSLASRSCNQPIAFNWAKKELWHTLSAHLRWWVLANVTAVCTSLICWGIKLHVASESCPYCRIRLSWMKPRVLAASS